MKFQIWTQTMALPVIACGCLLVAGCSQQPNDVPTAETVADHAGEEGGHGHNGYWCVEHGVPEEICAQCNSKLAAEFQEKGDWCDEHGRPDSQCFIHHPEFEEKFIAQYVAKFGEKPPARE